MSSNEIEWIDGSDANVKREALIDTAHYDAFGGLMRERSINSWVNPVTVAPLALNSGNISNLRARLQ
jgi:hypothetical protein